MYEADKLLRSSGELPAVMKFPLQADRVTAPSALRCWRSFVCVPVFDPLMPEQLPGSS